MDFFLLSWIIFLIFVPTYQFSIARTWLIDEESCDDCLSNDHSIQKRGANETNSALSTQLTDVSIQLEPTAPWENFLMPAPTVITLLGQLMVISTTVDFSLANAPPKDGFKYIRQPTSFRASLVQVSNDGWSAFHNAHKNMDKIQLYMQQIPAHVKTALKLILGASPQVLKRMLPVSLQTIRDIGTSCVSLAAETEMKFLDVMLLQGEILEATLSSKGEYDSKLFATQVELNTSAVQKDQLQTIGSELKERQKTIETNVKKYQDAYEKALKEIPTGWKAIAQDLLRSAVDMIKMAPNILTGGFGIGGMFKIGGSAGGGGGQSPQGGGGGQGGGAPDATSDFQASNILSVAKQYYDRVTNIKDVTKEVFSEQGTKKNPAGIFSAFDKVLNTFQDMLSSYTSLPLGEKVVKLIQKGRKFCDKMTKIASNSSNGAQFSDEEKQQAQDEAEALGDELKPMVAAGAYSSAGTSLQKPGGNEIPDSTFTGKHGNERFKAYLNLELLKDAEKRYDGVFSDILKYQEEMKKLMTRMAQLNMETINYKEILALIKEGVRMLSKIREQWSKLTSFFTAVSTRADVALQKTIVPFIKYIEAAQSALEDPSGDPAADRQFFKDLFMSQTADIHKIAFFLYTLSNTYVDISTQYLLDRLAGLAGVLAADTDAERRAAMTKLNQDNDKAQDAIKRLGEERRLNYKNKVQQRIEEANAFVTQLGGPTPTDTAAAKKGINAMKKKAENPRNPFDIDLS